MLTLIIFYVKGKLYTYYTRKMETWSIDGSIGAGKTTVIEKLRNRLGAKVVEEPLDEWKPWLDRYYNNKERWGFSFQMKVVLDQSKTLSRLKDNEFIIMERSPHTVYHVFANMLKDDNIIEPIEYDLIRDFIDYNTKPVKTIYLRCPPEICLERIKKRGRPNEQSINIEYLCKLHEKYEKIPNIHIVDSTLQEEEIYDIITKIIFE